MPQRWIDFMESHEHGRVIVKALRLRELTINAWEAFAKYVLYKSRDFSVISIRKIRGQSAARLRAQAMEIEMRESLISDNSSPCAATLTRGWATKKVTRF
jgi:galactokinase/mevalonate kinase-like predicted kinase